MAGAALGLAVLPSATHAQEPLSLGVAEQFGVLAGTAVNNTGPTLVTGDVGVSPGLLAGGFPPGTVDGSIFLGGLATQAQADAASAFADAAARTPQTILGTQLAATTLPPGVYRSGSGALDLAGTLTLNGQGDPTAVFIFQVPDTLTTATSSRVALTGSAQACNVFWQVGSSADLGPGSSFVGNVLALNSITVTAGVSAEGRLLARNGAVTLDSDTVTATYCDTLAPQIAVKGVPKACTQKAFKARIAVRDPLGVQSTDVSLDGRRIKRSGRASFNVAVKAAALRPGRHSIKVVSRDRSGNRGVRTLSFRRCPLPSLDPVFVG